MFLFSLLSYSQCVLDSGTPLAILHSDGMEIYLNSNQEIVRLTLKGVIYFKMFNLDLVCDHLTCCVIMAQSLLAPYSYSEGGGMIMAGSR